MISLTKRYGDHQRHGLTEPNREWIAASVNSIGRYLDEVFSTDPDTPEGWLKLSAPLNPDMTRKVVAPLEYALRAQGWNHVVMYLQGRHASVDLFAMYTDVVVYPLDGAPFSASISPEDDLDTVVRKITRLGTWHYQSDGSREFIPAHRITRVLHGEEIKQQ